MSMKLSDVAVKTAMEMIDREFFRTHERLEALEASQRVGETVSGRGLGEEVSRLRDQLAEALERLEEREATLSHANDDLREAREHVRALESQVQNFTVDTKELHECVARKDSRILELERQEASYEAECLRYRAEIEALREDAQHSLVPKLHSEVKKLQTSLANAIARAEDLQRKNSTLEARLASVFEAVGKDS